MHVWIEVGFHQKLYFSSESIGGRSTCLGGLDPRKSTHPRPPLSSFSLSPVLPPPPPPPSKFILHFISPPTGLRGAIAYALALNLADQGIKFASPDVIQVLSTTTLIIVLFTIIIFGGSTLPILKCLSKGTHGSDLTLSKTEDVGVAPAPSAGDQDEFPDAPLHERHQWFMILDYK